MMKVEGQQVDRGTVGAEDRGAKEGGVWGGGVPLPMGKGFGEGAVSPPQKIF